MSRTIKASELQVGDKYRSKIPREVVEVSPGSYYWKHSISGDIKRFSYATWGDVEVELVERPDPVEPPVGSIVIFYNDDGNTAAWQRVAAYWYLHGHNPMTWRALLAKANRRGDHWEVWSRP